MSVDFSHGISSLSTKLVSHRTLPAMVEQASNAAEGRKLNECRSNSKAFQTPFLRPTIDCNGRASVGPVGYTAS
jgi:hypothetical protein